MEGDSTLGGIPPSSAGLRPHGPWGTVEIRGTILLETLTLYSYMTFENTKVANIGKGSAFFFKLN